MEDSEVESMSFIVNKAIACSSVYQFIVWVAKRDAVAKLEHRRETYTANNHPQLRCKSTPLAGSVSWLCFGR